MNPILQYQGNAGLGLGANPDIPVSASPDTLNVLNDTVRNLTDWSNRQSYQLYQQKIADRDNLLNAIAADQISTGDILPEYRDKVDGAIAEMDNAFKNWKGDYNDIEGYRKYQEAKRKANDMAKLAQINTLQIKNNRLEKSREPIKSRQSDYDKFEQQELSKGLEDIVNPYQKQVYLDLDLLGNYLRDGAYGDGSPVDVTSKTTVTDKGGKITTQQSTTTKPATAPKGKQQLLTPIGANGLPAITSKQPDKLFNYDQVLGNATNSFLERGEIAEMQEKLIEGIQQMPYDQARRTIDTVNERIKLYNTQTSGRAKPVAELSVREIVDPATGEKRILIDEATPEFAAKFALAQNPGNYFEEGAEIFNKEAAEFGLKSAESRAKVGAMNALTSQRRAATALTNKKAKALDEQVNPIKLWDEISSGNVKNVLTTNGNYVPRINAAYMSEALKDALGIDPINSNGDYNVIPSKVVRTKKDGSTEMLSDAEVFRVYDQWLKNSPQAEEIRSKNGGEQPTVFDFLYTVPNVKYETEIVGKSRGKKNKLGVMEGGGEITRSTKIQTWLNQQMNAGRRGKVVDMTLEEENSSEE